MEIPLRRCSRVAPHPENMMVENITDPIEECEIRRWLRVCALFVVTACTTGFQMSFGSILVAFEEAFPSLSVSTLALVGAVSMGMMDLSAVISGMLIERYGERNTCVVGGVVAGGGLLLSSFASEAWSLIATYGGKKG